MKKTIFFSIIMIIISSCFFQPSLAQPQSLIPGYEGSLFPVSVSLNSKAPYISISCNLDFSQSKNFLLKHVSKQFCPKDRRTSSNMCSQFNPEIENRKIEKRNHTFDDAASYENNSSSFISSDYDVYINLNYDDFLKIFSADNFNKGASFSLSSQLNDSEVRQIKENLKALYSEWGLSLYFSNGTESAYTQKPVYPSEEHIKWIENHTFNVSEEIVLSYVNGNASSLSRFTSDELYSFFGTDTIESCSYHMFKNSEKISFSLIVSLPKIERSVTVTRKDDPFPWKELGYSTPCYLWDLSGDYAFLEDPVNIIFKSSSIDEVRGVILDKYPSWVGSNIVEKNFYVYDFDAQKWIRSRSVAESSLRTNGGCHVRLYELSDGTVVGGAHKDGRPPHESIRFEPFENQMSWDFEENESWRVLPNNVFLGNFNSFVWNDGFATVIEKKEK